MTELPPAEQRIQIALSTPVPRLYANSFVATLTTGDVLIALEHNGRPIALLNLSLTVAKTLGASLSGTISAIEAKMDRSIMTSAELEQSLKTFSDKSANKS